MKGILMSLSAVSFVIACLPARAQDSGPAASVRAIRALESRFSAAFRRKDVGAIMAGYWHSPKLFVFDVTPPREHRGWDDYKKDWEELFAAYPGPVDKFEITELAVAVDGLTAYGHSIQQGIMTRKDGSKLQFAVRVTDDYRRTGGRWYIVQEHVSVPVDLDTAKADLMSKP